MTEPEGMTAGSLVDSLGIEYEPDEGALVVGGAVLLKIVDKDGVVNLVTKWSDGINWLEKDAMLRTAWKFETKWIGEDEEDDC